ncbi:hypothetical protein VTK73DRAFT_5013 [Phialemonium thermophilum]|uniref:NodB homology domain-containing protein n=1 Tax=Phialemonium thermophilum TaxID=223376 RepID=A0ABR3WQI6_9PEZI
MATPKTRWPNGAKAAISFTMDNLGEAQDVYRGVWPANEPVGRHFSVTQNLPRMLGLLDRYRVRATYFAESWSLAVYPSAVDELLRRGHEVAWHGYQHEVWSSLSADAEAENLRKSLAAVADFNASRRSGADSGDGSGGTVQYRGFRPPGGDVNEGTYDLLVRNDFTYASPLGTRTRIERGLVVLPFEWRCVDAFYYMDKFAGIRKSIFAAEAAAAGRDEKNPRAQQDGVGADAVLPPASFRDYLLANIDETIAVGGYLSILFHPFLQTSEEKLAVLEEVLRRLGSDQDIWCAPCQEVAHWVRENADQFEP